MGVRFINRHLECGKERVAVSGESVDRRQHERPLACPVFAPAECRWAAEALPGGCGQTGNRRTKDWVQFWRRHKVATATGATLRRCVVAEPWLKEGALHKPRKAD